MTRSPNRSLRVIFLGALFFLALVVFFPPLRDIFRFAAVSLPVLAAAGAIGFISVLWFEAHKVWKRRDPHP